MATADHPFPRREPVENAERETIASLQQYVMSQAAKLPYFWPEFNAEMTQEVLQAVDVEDGTYILRPSGNVDPAARRFLTLSIRMDFPKEPTRVWHFPVIITAEEGSEDSPPLVHFSLTQSSNPASNQINTLAELLEYHHQRPLKGGKLPNICRVVKGLPYRASTDKDRDSSKRDAYNFRAVYEFHTMSVDESESSDAPTPDSSMNYVESVAPVATARTAATLQPSKSHKESRPTSPKPPPRSITLPPRKIPQPAPRRNVIEPAPQLPPRDSDCSTSSNESIEYDKTNGPATCDSPIPDDPTKSKICQCGLPLEVTYLPKFWTVHRSNYPDTMNMLYFRNPAGRTAWALPPYIDRECQNRSYLQYGRLNVSCFQQYSAEMNYASSSELSHWSDYSTYSQRSS